MGPDPSRIFPFNVEAGEAYEKGPVTINRGWAFFIFFSFFRLIYG
ncbi:hypothetical protein JOC95_002556 [Bacillus tianshenii]|uniref:Uncharacterized protein n=1 Tax=Sutcliffiella tianshenii TaxID=1463404 RepID=A0ABS2P176_9BACI|nr:hypothetical protein [Bacillus tianshenii]